MLVLVLLLIQSWPSPLANAWNGPAWSLSVEAFLYAAFPALVGIARRSVKACLLILLGCWICSSVPPLVFGLYGNPASTLSMYLLFFPPLRLPEFVAGMALAAIYRRSEAGKHALAPLGTVLLLGALFLVGTFTPAGSDRLLALPPICALMLTLAMSSGGGLFGSRTAVHLGAASYALYILHIPLGSYYMMATGRAGGRLEGWIDCSAYVVSATVVCVVLHFLFEVPMASWVNRRFGGVGNASREADRLNDEDRPAAVLT